MNVTGFGRFANVKSGSEAMCHSGDRFGKNR